MDDFVFGHFEGRHPVAEVEPVADFLGLLVEFLLEHGAFWSEPSEHVFHLVFHRLIVHLQLFEVAILEIVFPRNDVHGSSPSHSASTTRLPRSTIGHIASLWVLSIAHIAQPLMIEGRSIEVEHHLSRCNLTVASIGRTFAMRAIAGNAAMHIVHL